MEVEVTILTRRGAAVMRRSQRVSADRVRFGRGTDNEILLGDIRVELSAASLQQRDGRLYMDKLGAAPIHVNGQPVDAAPVRTGDEVLIGPYRLQFTEPPPGTDVAVALELAHPIEDATSGLRSQVRIGLDQTHLSRRGASWIGFVIVALFGLMLPIAVYLGGYIPAREKAEPTTQSPAPGVTAVALSWSPGEISNSHRFFAAECKTCHRAAFTAVPDNACLSCHGKVGAHAESAADIGPLRARLDGERCTSCHEEHRGQRGTVIREAKLCVNCHRSLDQTAPKADIRDVGGFPDDHPQFRVTVVSDKPDHAPDRVALGGTPPVDHPGIKFSHKDHLDTLGKTILGDRQVKGCADCHRPEPGGMGFLPITYKSQCQSCHELTFDLPAGIAKVPHGDDVGVATTVWNFYAGQAVQGGIADPDAPEVLRRAPGSLTAAQGNQMPKDVREWVARKSEAALRTIVLDDKRGCAYCHLGTGPEGRIDTAKVIAAAPATPDPAQPFIAPVQMRARFLPHAQFDHAKHVATACEKCHGAATSQSSGDVLIPGIQMCVGCHGGEGATLRAESTCVTCHVFHRNEFGPMRDTAAK
jgi:predicted CXXCH cytochrome family protein